MKARDYAEFVNNMLSAFRNLGCNMSIKMHCLFSYMDRFPENLGSMSDEQGERFHQDMKEMETSYQGRCDAVMMADHCWTLKRDLPDAEHSRSSKKWKFKPWSVNNGEAPCYLSVLSFITAAVPTIQFTVINCNRCLPISLIRFLNRSIVYYCILSNRMYIIDAYYYVYCVSNVSHRKYQSNVYYLKTLQHKSI